VSKFATLIVEDTVAYQQSYRRAVERQEGEAVIASSYDEAVQAIRRRLFPVAIVDVVLSEKDETNMDGLKVLEFISRMGDTTNSVLITGYGTFQVAKEAFRTHDVFEGLQKGAPLSTVETTISRAYEKFQERSSREKLTYTPVLKGPVGPLWEWEDRALRACSPKGGADGLYRFLDSLLRDLIPLIHYASLHGCIVDDKERVVMGLFWSRRVGQAVLLAFGQKTAVLKLQNEAEPAQLKALMPSVESLQLERTIKRVEAYGICGLVRLLAEQDFDKFETSSVMK
jgi:ActR/RegA family two-component response regulator